MVGTDKARRYSLPEVERRFLISELPGDIRSSRRLFDRYLVGGHLRLRRVEDLGGGVIEWKLGHKFRPDPQSAGLIFHTTVYLTEAEYQMLVPLPGDDLVKTRHVFPNGSVDVHEDGSMILEVEFGSEEQAAAFTPPHYASREVTDDEGFTGAGLAARRRLSQTPDSQGAP